MAAAIALALDDPPIRLMLLTQLVARIESGAATPDLLRAGLDLAGIEQLRAMSISDALQVANNPCGLAFHVQPVSVQSQLAKIARGKKLREQLEYCIVNGASPRLLMQLFRISPGDARRMRKHLAPSVAAGGRTKAPSDEERTAITAAWHSLSQTCPDECDRVIKLHQQFHMMWIASLELVILPPGPTLTVVSG